MPSSISHTSLSQKEHFRQMKIPESWNNNSYKNLLIEQLLEEEKKLNEDVKECIKDKDKK